MNTSFNYSGFVEMFLESDEDFESYGVITEGLVLLESHAHSASAEKSVISKAILRALD